MVFFEDQNVVHMGDLVFNRRHPYVDRGAGASIKNWIEVLDAGINRFGSSTTYIFGHAGEGYEVTGTIDDLKAFQDYLGKVLEFVDAGIKAGKTKDEILKATEIPGAPQWKGDGIQRPLGAAFDELTAKS
jgi:glyoxylase-like metal-dependent hydrolase (beta-lactamase superfamily II)